MDPMRRLAEQQHGLIAREQALAFGMTSNQIGARLRRGTLERTARNVTVNAIPTTCPERTLLDLCGSAAKTEGRGQG
jgi:hypothetical protein